MTPAVNATRAAAAPWPHDHRVRRLAGRALRPVVAHPALAVLVVAFVVRAVASVVIFVTHGGSLTLDDQTYHDLAATAARPHPPPGFRAETAFFRQITGSYLVPLTLLYRVTGPFVLVGQLYSAVLGAITAALVVVLVRHVLAAPWPLVAGLGVALFPSQILWSSLTLKDSTSWAVLAALAVTVGLAVTTSSLRRLLWCTAAAAAMLFVLAHLRGQTAVVAAVALVLAALIGSRELYVPRLVLAVAVAVLMPLAGGLGPAGADFVSGHQNVAAQRVAGAQGARSAIVTPARNSSAQAADDSVGHNIAYLPHGLVAVLLQPFPVGRADSVGLALARAEALLWYPVLALAFIGVVAGRRRLRPLTFALLVAGGLSLVYALSEGNFGTSYRHRGEIVWIAVVFATIGLHWVVTRRKAGEPTS